MQRGVTWLRIPELWILCHRLGRRGAHPLPLVFPSFGIPFERDRTAYGDLRPFVGELLELCDDAFEVRLRDLRVWNNVVFFPAGLSGVDGVLREECVFLVRFHHVSSTFSSLSAILGLAREKRVRRSSRRELAEDTTRDPKFILDDEMSDVVRQTLVVTGCRVHFQGVDPRAFDRNRIAFFVNACERYLHVPMIPLQVRNK